MAGCLCETVLEVRSLKITGRKTGYWYHILLQPLLQSGRAEFKREEIITDWFTESRVR